MLPELELLFSIFYQNDNGFANRLIAGFQKTEQAAYNLKTLSSLRKYSFEMIIARQIGQVAPLENYPVAGARISIALHSSVFFQDHTSLQETGIR